ncbi:RimJ/RimL family protein N-acetyltransferase [Tumebacillus sp. BK434]|uniref:GNAT family N-acetyltransferase n=1 Tax=Tumebacillus sp. BK434 TaxID=2512169 RepID=UPI00104E4578|nr:GNAT family protein [Tumebacillus sp. BK434]TCP58176.1 RimJ/RimL family protein N-acetyltransferase [Tumebacillus sp. BK434]
METTRTHLLKDGRTLTIREAAPADAAMLVAYMQQVACESPFLGFGPGEFTTTPEQEVGIIEDHFQTDNKIFLIGLIDGEIASVTNFVGGQRQRSRHVGEFGITVRESFWGLGIATHMLTLLIDWAKATGIVRKINLLTREDNHAAIHLYKKLGFVQEGVHRKASYLEGTFYDAIFMGIDID